MSETPAPTEAATETVTETTPSPDLSGGRAPTLATSAPSPFTLVGVAAPVCVDGVCELPPR